MNILLPVAVFFPCAVVFAVFLLWYGGRGRAMSEAEADALLDRVQRTRESADLPMMPELLESLRDVTRGDDGHEFVMVNLIKYRQKAVYPPGFSFGDDPRGPTRNTTEPSSLCS